MRKQTIVDATFRPNDDQPPWTGRLRQTIHTRTLDSKVVSVEGLRTVAWDRPDPPVPYFPAATGTLEIVGKPPCDAWWGNGRFNHSDGFIAD